MHLPLKAKPLLGHDKQKLAEPTHVAHSELQAMSGLAKQFGKGICHLRMHVASFWEETNLPAGQLWTHCPFDKKYPGKHPVHCAWLIVDAVVKFGIVQDEQCGPQAIPKRLLLLFSYIMKHLLSHSFLLLSAIIPFAPSQTPLLSAPTQLPLNMYFPSAQIAQSFEDGPVHVRHDGEHGVHCAPLLKLPSGQIVPEDVVA